MWWVIHMCRGFDPLFSFWQDRARSFWGTFSHPPTAKLSFGVQKLPIFTKIDLFGPKFNFFLNLFGSNFQRPAAHPHQFSGQVPPPGYSPSKQKYWRLPGPVFCLLLEESSDYAQPITGQVTEVTCPVISWAQPELTPSKRERENRPRSLHQTAGYYPSYS